MKRLAFAIGVLALGFSAATAAHADFAVVRFNSNYCRVWTDTAQRTENFQYLAFQRYWRGHRWWQYRFDTLAAAQDALHEAVSMQRCHQ